jgi:hypothetical protein
VRQIIRSTVPIYTVRHGNRIFVDVGERGTVKLALRGSDSFDVAVNGSEVTSVSGAEVLHNLVTLLATSSLPLQDSNKKGLAMAERLLQCL